MGRKSKKQQDTQAEWENKIYRAKKVRQNWKDQFRVDLAYEYFEGRQKDPSYSNTDWITINSIYSHVKSQLPALYSADPYFYVKLKRSFHPNPMEIALWEKRGMIRSAYLNYLKGELKLKEKSRICIQDAFFKYGVAKVHYTTESTENPDFGKSMMAEDEITPLIDETSGEPLMEPEVIPINGRYNITRILPDDILWDEDAGTLEDDWTWIAQRVRMTLEQAKKNPLYKKQALKSLEFKGETEDDELRAREERKKGNNIKGRSELFSPTEEKRAENELVSFWEIYNLKKGTWLVIAENGEIPVMEERELPPGVEKHPFAFLFFTRREDSPYPIPRMSQGLDPAREYNRARSDIQKHRKRFNRKYIASKQAFGNDTSEISKLESGDDGTIIMANMTGDSAITPIKDAQLDQMRYQELAYLKAEMIELLGGSSDEARGIAGADSATQAGILDKRLEMKEGDALSMVVDFVTTIARKLDQLVQTHITRDEAIKVVGPQGEFWELVRQDDYTDIDGEYEYSVNVGATIPQLPQVERQSWMAFLGMAFSNPAMLLSKRLFKKMAELHHIEDEAMLEEIYRIAVGMIKGQIPMGQQQASQAGIGESRPMSAVGGAPAGIQSLVKGNAAISG